MASVSRRFITPGSINWPHKISPSPLIHQSSYLRLVSRRPQPRSYWWSSKNATPTVQDSSSNVLPDPPVWDITTVPSLELGSLKSLGLASSFTPVGWIQSLMEAINVSTGFPWYLTIISTTTLIRLIGLRFTLRSTRASANMIPVRAEYEGLMNDLKAAAQSGDSMKRNVIAMQIRKMQKEHGISPWNIMQGPLIQVVSSIAGFIAIKRLCDLPLEQMKAEGFAWIPSLTAADPTYILPILSVAAMNIQMRLGRLDALASGSKAALHFGNVFPILSVASLAVLSFLPSGVLLHLLTNITLISIQSAILRTPAIRAKLRFPPLSKSKPGEIPTYRETLAAIKGWFAENRRQALETAERRSLVEAKLEYPDIPGYPRTHVSRPLLTKMTDDLINSTAASGHRKMLHGKRSFSMARHTHLDSPAYDASEEDNDPLTDDGGSTMSVPASRTHHHGNVPPSSTTAVSGSNLPTGSASRAQLFQVKRTQPHVYQSHAHSHTHHASRIAAILSSDIDEGVDSPTYDGDVESSSTAVARDTDVLSSTGTPLASPILTTSNELRHMSNLTLSTSQYHEDLPASNTPRVVELSNTALGNPTPSEQVAFHPATSTEEEIQSWIQDIIHNSNTYRKFPINPPPLGRPVRIYADGVYDLFHFGHALQLRQAKLSFPSVYLLVGVCSDELVRSHKSDIAMNHIERCESVRNCRWVDQVVPEAPWVIDQSFLDKWEIDYVAHDEEPYSSIDHDDVYNYVKSQGKFLPTRRTPGISTSILLERIVSYYRLGVFDAKLEKGGHEELKARGSNYDNHHQQ